MNFITKKAKLVVVAGLTVYGALIVIVSLWTENARAFVAGPPTGRTGAPGESTCTGCHSPTTNTGQFHIVPPAAYAPGQTYTVQVQNVTNDLSRAAWGFELTSLTSTNTVAGTFANTTTFTRTRTGGGRNYIEQTTAGAFIGQTGGSTWTFSWTAPSIDMGPITFYAAGLQADNSSDENGDQTYTTSVVVPVGGPTPTPTPISTPTPTPAPTPTPTPGSISISGTVIYCSNPTLPGVPGVTMTLTGTSSGSTSTDGVGNYTFPSLISGGTYTVTPTRTALTPSSTGINTVDVVSAQRHFLAIVLLTGCRLTAADVNGDSSVNTVDVIAVQRFFLGYTTGIANVGKYNFSPANRVYTGITTNQTAQNYDALVFGDTATAFIHRPESASQLLVADEETNAVELPATVRAVTLPNIHLNPWVTNFIAPVTTSAIDAKSKLVAFQGDFTFDQRVVHFQSQPVQNAGLTAGNWNVSGNVLEGKGPIRTLRVSAYSNDFTPLSGSGTLFDLRMTRVDNAAQGTQLIWAAPPDHFIFIDADLKTQKPGYAATGGVQSEKPK